ncbi:DoxX family protein [Polaribacter sp. Asnod1-A03]|uniref:DoxX family protein n=1 Tax=Polaribacter sp. Asnod1-A03 TaxID=3160581 RepID=UPI0038649F51
MKTTKIIYYISTALLSVIMLFSAGMYLFNYETVSGFFTNLGYPTYIIYPLAIAKILGLIAIWFINSKSLKEWAYAGFFFDFVLAFFAHYMVKDGGYMSALVAIILLAISYITYKKIANGQR